MKQLCRYVWLSLITLLFFSSGALSKAFGEMASYDNFYIGNFKWVEDKEMALYLDGRTRIYGNKDSQKFINTTYISSSDHQYYISQINVEPLFEMKHNTRDNEFKLSLPLNFEYLFQGNDFRYASYQTNSITENKNDDDSKSIYFSVMPSADYRLYLNPLFLGLQLNLNGSESFRTRDDFTSTSSGETTSYYDENETLTWSANGILRIGCGRAYEGQYAYEAMQTVSDLNQEGLLLKTLSATDMYLLSEIIAKERSKYRLDTRKRIKDAVQKIADFMIEHQYIQPDSVASILTIEDTYRYVNFSLGRKPQYFISGNSRKFGMIYNIRIGGDYSCQDNKNRRWVENSTGRTEMENEYQYENYKYFLGAEWDYYQPLSQKWQMDIEGVVDYYPGYKDEHGDLKTHYSSCLAPGFTATLVYIANSRWKFFIRDNISLEAGQVKNECVSNGNELNEEYYNFDLSNRLAIGANYEMNYNLDVNLSAGATYEYKNCLDYKLAGNAFESSTNPTLAELNDILRDQNKKSDIIDWNVWLSVSYRLF